MKNILLISLFLVSTLTLAACGGGGNLENPSEEHNKLPFDVYNYTDSDGCVYLVASESNGDGVGMTQKVNQPETCLKESVE